MYVVFHSNFAAYIVYRRCVSRVSFLNLFGPIAGVTIQLCNHFSGEYIWREILK